MFGFFKKQKKSVSPEEKKTLTIPIFSDEDFTIDNIATYLRNGTPILTVYDPRKAHNSMTFNLLFGVENNGLNPSVYMYRKEGKLLCCYTSFQFEDDRTLHFMLLKVWEFKNSNIMELFNSDLKDADEIYHDDENVVASQRYYVHDFTEEEGIEYFTNHPMERSIYIGKDRLVKKETTETDEDN